MLDDNDNHTAMKAYDLQCCQVNTADIVVLLKQTYETFPTFVFHRIQYND